MANRTSTAPRQTQAPPANAEPQTAMVPAEVREVAFVPLAETEAIKLTVSMVMNMLAVKTRSGKTPSYGDCIKFIMLCKARKLNPFVSDAYLIGYDTTDGPVFNLITAIQALRKRAEGNPNYDGTRKGIIVKAKHKAADGTEVFEIVEREGCMRYDNETLLGAWAEVYRKDRTYPEKSSLKFSTYDTGQSRWKKDPEGMIVKCAEAAALRPAFPSDLAGLYIAEEFEAERERKPVTNGHSVTTAARLADLAGRAEPGTPLPTQQPAPAPQVEGFDGDPEPAAAPPAGVPDNPVKRGELELQLSRCQKLSDVEAVMLLARNDKSLSAEDYDQLNEKAGVVEANIKAAEAGEI